MEIADLYRIRMRKAASQVCAEYRQSGRDENNASELAGNYRDECFIISRGLESLPHSDVAAELSLKTARWGYELIRQRALYWADKDKLIIRIFRTTNITLWQKQRDTGFGDGLAAAMAVVVTTSRTVHIGLTGNVRVMVIRDGAIIRESADIADYHGVPANLLGMKRYGMIPQCLDAPFDTAVTVLMMTPGIFRFADREDILRIVREAPRDKTGSGRIADQLVRHCQSGGSSGPATAYVIRKVAAE